MRRILLTIILLSGLSGFIYSQENMIIAVSPFDNLSKNIEENYIGFQISEYMTSALSSIEDVKVLERSKIEKVITEQKLQLSGLTDGNNAVEVGNLLNAKQMLVGSYIINDKKININGRIIDVETSEVSASANISAPFSGDINTVMYDFFFRLLDKKPPQEVFSQMSMLEQRISRLESEKSESSAEEIEELKSRLASLENSGKELKSTIENLKISLAVEAQLSLLKDQDQKNSADIAKAMEASFSNNDEKAFKYLQTAIADPAKNYLSYNLSANSYYEKLSALEGESIFVKMIQKQLETNKILSKDTEAISRYRSTLKLLTSRLYSSLHQDMFTLEVGKAEDMTIGNVSATVSLPSDISININDGTKRLLNNVIKTQDIIKIQEKSAAEKPYFNSPPPYLDKLLPGWGLKELFPIKLNASAGYSIQFVDKNGEVLYELFHSKVNAFSFNTDEEIIWGKKADNSYSEKHARNGWKYKDGKVEIQARELRNLHGVKVVLDRKSVDMNYSFPVYSDTKWKSILMHAYRQKYLKIATDNKEDKMPQVKDLVITHSVFSVGNYLKNIPLLVDTDYLAGMANLTAVVYWGDNSDTVVTGEWRGAKDHASENYIGKLNPESVIYFKMPAVMKSGHEYFTVGNNENKRTVFFKTVMGESWKSKINSTFLQVSRDRIYISDNNSYSRNKTKCLDSDTGNIVWESDLYSSSLHLEGGRIYTASDGRYNKTACLDAKTGKTIWQSNISSQKLQLAGNRVFTCGERYKTACLNADTGKTIWQSDIGGASYLQVTDSKVFIAQGRYQTACLDADTGEIIWKSDMGSVYLQVADSRVFIASYYKNNTACLDADTGKTIWKSDAGSKDLKVSGSRVYTAFKGKNYKTACLDADTGKTIWKSDMGSSSLQLVSNRIYTSYGDCLDADTGKTIWESDGIGGSFKIAGGRIFSTGKTEALDLTILEPWYALKSAGDDLYNKLEYFSAYAYFSQAVNDEGAENAILLYRYAYSKEQLDGLTPAVKNSYYKAWVNLKKQNPGHRLIASAEKKMK